MAYLTESSGNVFTDLGFSPNESANLEIRADLMLKVRRIIEDRGLTQVAAASLFGVSQPRISDVVRGKLHVFTIDMLVTMLRRAGLKTIVVEEISVPAGLAPSAGRASTTMVTLDTAFDDAQPTLFDLFGTIEAAHTIPARLERGFSRIDEPSQYALAA